MADDLKKINKAVEDLGLQHGIDIRKLEADSKRLKENMQNILNDAQAQHASYNEKKAQIREAQALNQKIMSLRNKAHKTPEERDQLKRLETERAQAANKIHQPSPSADQAATSAAAKTSNATPSPASRDATASSNQKLDAPLKEEPLYPTIASPYAVDPEAQNSEKPTEHTLLSQVNEPSLKPQDRTIFDADDIEKDADQLEIELYRNLEVRKNAGLPDDPEAEAEVRKAIAALREEAQQLRTQGHDAPENSNSASPTPNQPAPSSTNELQPEEDLKPAPEPRPKFDLTKDDLLDLAESGELSEEEMLELAEGAELSKDDIAELEEFFSEKEEAEKLNDKDPEPDPEIEEPRVVEKKPEDEVAGAVQFGPSQSMRTGEIVDTRPPGFTGGVSGSLIDGSGQSMNLTGGKRFKRANKEVEDLVDAPGGEATERQPSKNNQATQQKEVNQAENLQNNNAVPQMTPGKGAKANTNAEEDEGILTKSASFAINALTLGWANMGQKRRDEQNEEYDYRSPAPGY